MLKEYIPPLMSMSAASPPILKIVVPTGVSCKVRTTAESGDINNASTHSIKSQLQSCLK